MKLNKLEYVSPEVLKIELDNEISLALESEPPVGPSELTQNMPEYFNNDPFGNNV